MYLFLCYHLFMKKRDILIITVLSIAIGGIAAGVAYDAGLNLAERARATKTVVKPVAADKPVFVEPHTILIPQVIDVISKTNEYRVYKGLTPLSENALLTQSACAKAQHMIDNDYWAHIAPDGTEPWYWINQTGYIYSRAGENLAYGQRTSAKVSAGWINSTTHRENILGDFTEVGVCVMYGKYQGDSNSLTVAHYGKPL
ncbi:CAP domain-containing protein [Candidatus Saccharibacteria bacterium]|nr:CAP domain-containing protein [Candidatus Saccharibacteria bacterium]